MMLTRVIKEEPPQNRSGNTIIEVGLPPLSTPTPAPSYDATFLVIALCILLLGGGAGAALGLQLPRLRRLRKLVQASPSAATYCQQLWSQQVTCPDLLGSDSSKKDVLTFLWDNYPNLSSTIEAMSLLTQWPPAQGSRFRLNSFGLSPSGDSWASVFQTAFALVSLNRTGPFLGWSLSAFDAFNWAKPNIYFGGAATVDEARLRSDFFRDFLWVEVTRTCEAAASYPSCDEGAVKFQHAAGSGVAFNIGRTLARLNKVDAAVFLAAQLAATSLKTSADLAVSAPLASFYSTNADARATLTAWYRRLLKAPSCTLDAYASASTAAEFLQTARSQIAAELESLQGSSSTMGALRKPTEQIVFREMTSVPTTSTLVTTSSLVGVAGACLLLMLGSVFLLGKISPLQPLTFFLFFCVLLVFGFLYGMDVFLSGLGYATLSRALTRHGVSAEKVVGLLTSPDASASTEDAKVQQAFSGMASTQSLDAFVETAASLLGYDTVIYQCQASEVGYFYCCLVDVTRVKCYSATESPSVPDLEALSTWQSGTCATERAPSCKTTPFPAARAAKTLLRGGLALQESLTDYGIAITAPYMRVSTFAALSRSPTYDASSQNAYLTNLKTWLKDAAPCTCTEVKAECLGCKDSVSGDLCA